MARVFKATMSADGHGADNIDALLGFWAALVMFTIMSAIIMFSCASKDKDTTTDSYEYGGSGCAAGCGAACGA